MDCYHWEESMEYKEDEEELNRLLAKPDEKQA